MPPFVAPRTVVPTPQRHPAMTSKTSQTPASHYFASHTSDDDSSTFPFDREHRITGNSWSSPSSVVRSIAITSPNLSPHNQNSDLDAFRRQSEGKAFNMGGLGVNVTAILPPATTTLRARRSSRTSPPKESPYPPRPRQPSGQSLDPVDLARSPKRVLSPGSAARVEVTRRGSPGIFSYPEPDGLPRLSLPLDDVPAPYRMVRRAETLPESSSSSSSNDAASYFVTGEYVLDLMESKSERLILLDLRVSTQYNKSHIDSALNLCIPTTLLKRPSFNVQKLADTLKDERQRRQFEEWRSSRYIIVYDAASSELRDAQSCLNTIKKFRNEGYQGQLHIIKGGFIEFAGRFGAHLHHGVGGEAGRASSTSTGPDFAPVVGGLAMPGTGQPANPFFGNIRQNMDLIGGVGQIPLKHPARADPSTEMEIFPEWLQRAADDKDHGKKVSNKFEAIERREKKRMEDALSSGVAFGSPREQESACVQIAGLEKGSKNRYNNIWPYEHSRVKLQGVRPDACDYFNASFLQAGWSHKRYISTQAPIPATFNDFWNVVWQQDVRVIVMLTAEKEGAQVKAHNYWNGRQYGPLQLDFLGEKRASLEMSRIHRHQSKGSFSDIRKASGSAHRHSSYSTPLTPLAPQPPSTTDPNDQPHVTVRKFSLSHSRHPFEPMREITQLQYSSWPDFGAPAHPSHLLALVEQTNAVVRATQKNPHPTQPEPPNERPVLVHCSAGCGRTGTFCTVDSVIDMLKRQRLERRREVERRATRTPRTPRGTQRPKGGGDDFFASKTPAAQRDEEGVGPEGTWVGRNDVDLVERTVEDFRLQRLSMVQSLRQYVLCYESVMEWLVDQSLLDGT